jgi:hypothetical protein
MVSVFLQTVGAFILAVVLSGCAATSPIISEWRNPAYGPASFKRVMVGGLGGETSVRRNFEDEFVTQLRALGVDALPSYRFVSEGEAMDEAKLKQAAQKAGADAMLFARSIQVEQKTEYGPLYFPAPWFGIYGHHVGVSWQGLYGAPSVYRYNEYTSETTLYDLTKNEVVWTGTIKTTEPDDVKTAIKNYVEAVMKALQEKNLLPERE